MGPPGAGGSDTAQQILDKLNAAGFDEAAGSDLNGDKLDGLHAASFLRADQGNTANITTTGLVAAASYSVGGQQVILATREWKGEPVTQLGAALAEQLVHKSASHLYRSSRLSTLRVRATGAGFTGARNRDVKLDGTDHADDLRGLHLTLIRLADHTVVFDRAYDTATKPEDAAALATKLASSDTSQLVVLASYDSWEGQRSAELAAQLLRCGASTTVLGGGPGSAYLLVGICGMGSGSGIELHQTVAADAMAEVMALLVDGAVVGLSSGGATGALQGDLTLSGNVIKSNGEIRDARAAFDFLRPTTAGASGYLFEEAGECWGLYYDGAAQRFLFTRAPAGPAGEQVGDPAAQLYLEHDGTDGTLGTHDGDLLLLPAAGLVKVAGAGAGLQVGSFPAQSLLDGRGLALPVGSGTLGSGLRVAGSSLELLGVGGQEASRLVRVRSRLKVDSELEVDGPIPGDPEAGAVEAGGKLLLSGAPTHGAVTIQNYTGGLRIYTAAGQTETVRIFGWGNGTAQLEVEGLATFQGGLVVEPAAPLLLPGTTAGSLGRIGLGVANPQRQLHLFNTTGSAGLRLETTTASGSGSWEVVAGDSGSLALRDLAAGADRLLQQQDGTVAVGGPLDLVNRPLRRAGGIALSAPGGADKGLFWQGSGAVSSAIYVSGHKDGRDASDGPMWFASDDGFRFTADRGGSDAALLALTAAGDLRLAGRLGVGSPDPQAGLEVRGTASVLADLPASTVLPPAVSALLVVAAGQDRLGRGSQLLLGSPEAPGDYAQIGLGWAGDDGTEYAPAVLGYQATDTAGAGRGDLLLATRSLTTDSAPRERLRILASASAAPQPASR
ncbi:MAG: hypothetical protein FJ125_00345 [Deltaproteobacteria bacterium]|nr:hypothetical protein [Deltaproteobacteria bacterium]